MTTHIKHSGLNIPGVVGVGGSGGVGGGGVGGGVDVGGGVVWWYPADK